MGSRLPSTKAIQLLNRRGPLELAKALKRCWLEECVHEDSPYVNMAVATVRIHAPLDEYELLRNLPSDALGKLLDLMKEVYSSDSLDVVSIDFELETNDQTSEQTVAAIEELKSVMISVATGERNIKEVNEEYKKRRAEISKMLHTKGMKDPNLFGDLWAWYNRWKKVDLPTYQSRRLFVADLYDPLLEQLRREDSLAPGMFEKPTGWAKVDRTVVEIRQRLQQASTEEQFQTVGTLCRETLISLAQAVFDSGRHPVVDGVQVSPTDFKRMIEAYLAKELAGESMKHARQHAKAAFDLANELQHKRTATFLNAALCAEATAAVVNLVAIVSGRRSP